MMSLENSIELNSMALDYRDRAQPAQECGAVHDSGMLVHEINGVVKK